MGVVSSFYVINNQPRSNRWSQRDILASFLQSVSEQQLYKRLVVLSMDFDTAFDHIFNPGFNPVIGGVEYNKPRTQFSDQLNELLQLANRNVLNQVCQDAEYQTPLELLPFMCIDPRSYTQTRDLLKAVQDFRKNGGHGIKLYPPLGYIPEDERLYPLFEYCMKNNIPLLSHCSIGGSGRKGALNCSELAHPYYWIPVIDRLLAANLHGKFKLCLAHFGSMENEADIGWWDEIIELIEHYSGKDQIMIFTDTSANIPKNSKQARAFFKERFTPIWENKGFPFKERILFGSDWWMQLYSITETEYIHKMFRKWANKSWFPEKNADKFMKQLELNADEFLS